MTLKAGNQVLVLIGGGSQRFETYISENKKILEKKLV